MPACGYPARRLLPLIVGPIYIAKLLVPCSTASESVPSADTLRASLLLSSVKANSSWFFCRLSLMSRAAHLLLFLLTPQGDRSFDRLPHATAGFTISALDGYGLCCHAPTRPAPDASYPVLVHRLVRLLHASFRPRLAKTPLRFAITSPASGL